MFRNAQGWQSKLTACPLTVQARVLMDTWRNKRCLLEGFWSAALREMQSDQEEDVANGIVVAVEDRAKTITISTVEYIPHPDNSHHTIFELPMQVLMDKFSVAQRVQLSGSKLVTFNHWCGRGCWPSVRGCTCWCW